MVVTIVEGGELARVLVRFFLLFGHKINVIIKEETDICKFNEPGVNLIQGDGTDINILARPCILQSNLVIALMNRDVDNLSLCMFIKKHDSAMKTVTKVNNPRYTAKYEKLGIDIAFDYASLLSDLIEHGKQNESD